MSMKAIVDLGVSEGNDSFFYMQKGFKVFGVEADPSMVEHLKSRFREEIGGQKYKLLHFVAGDAYATEVSFYVSTEAQGASSVEINPYLKANMYKPPTTVRTIDWRGLLEIIGEIPRYVKIDIEGNEVNFLRGVASSGVFPEFMSVECHCDMSNATILHNMGYHRFALVEQLPLGGFRMPNPQLEGNHVDNPCFDHGSGPFGLDVFGFGDWTDFEGLCAAWEAGKPNHWRTWYDCHVWKPR